ncbi:hypothetical protein [Paenibacillus crassostreae]|uniref:hypothetical protein n=1 Tax=Paenibacillus crassostreae TaxID=1763538 RepID=UPI000AEA3F1D|nr:hypothetical protein [Paenibacillus crassostreae]
MKGIQDHYQWLLQIVEEMMEFFVIDLLKMPSDKPIIIDLGINLVHRIQRKRLSTVTNL